MSKDKEPKYTRPSLRFSTHRVENLHHRYLHGATIGAFCEFLTPKLVNGIYMSPNTDFSESKLGTAIINHL